MGWQPSVYTALAAAGAVPFGVFTLIGWRRQKAAASAFGRLTFGGLLWAACYGIQLGFTTRSEQLFWQRPTLAISGTVPPLLLLFALRYAGRDDLISSQLHMFLAAEAVAFAAVVMTNPVHHLVWTDAALRSSPFSPVLSLTFGVGYYVHIAYAYSVVLVALGVLFSVLFRTMSVYHKQVSLLILGAVPAFLCHVAYTLGLSPVPGLDLTPFAFTVTTVLYGLALFHFDLLDQTPVARQRALEVVGDGLLVVDEDEHVVDANRVARQALEIDAGTATFPQLSEGASLAAVDGTTMTALIDESRRVFRCHVSRLHDDHGEFTGYAIVLRDVTEREAYEQRLEVSNRVLRHNVRNDMNVVQGYAEALGDAVDSAEQEQMATTIRENATSLVSLSEKLRQAIVFQEEADATTVVDAGAVVRRLHTEFSEEYPSVAFPLDVPDAVRVSGIAEDGLALAVRNLLENAVEHNDADDLEIGLSVRRENGRVCIGVSDTGSGLPAVERDVLESRVETPLRHSTGIGLWLTRWLVNAAGGEVHVDDDAEGTTITLELPSEGDPPIRSSGSARAGVAE